MTCTRATVSFGLFVLWLGCKAETPAGDDDPGTESGIVTASATEGDDTTDPSEADDSLDGTESSGSGSETGFNCGEVDYQLQAIPPNVVLVLDKSGSMVSDSDNDGDGQLDGFWDHDDDPLTDPISRWNSLYNVVEFVVDGFEMQINFGAMLFPSEDATNQYSANACRIEPSPEIPVAPLNAAAILAGIPGATVPDLQGATPATAGIEAAITHLETLDPEVPRFMILVTDGAANCSAQYPSPPELLENYDEDLPEVVEDAFAAREIPTFVVGIDIADELTGVGADGLPEANTFVELNAVAVAGGRARAGDEKFFNTTNEIELMAALGEIAGQVVSCVIPLDPPPVHPDFVEVEIAGETVERVSDCATEDGWVFVNPDGPYDALELCGTACDLLVEAGTVDATYGCPPAG